VLPQYPYCEQQLPYVEPWQVLLVVGPQVLSVLICKVEGLDELEFDVPQLPNADWHPVPQ
jgi:hypothetical protein